MIQAGIHAPRFVIPAGFWRESIDSGWLFFCFYVGAASLPRCFGFVISSGIFPGRTEFMTDQRRKSGGKRSHPKDFKEFLQEFGASLPLDQRLYRQDIRGSRAHCRMLAQQGIVSKEDAERILRGLEEILQEIDQGVFPFSLQWEDIHMNVERRLIDKIGEVGGKLHTARSRNDQVALDERLFLKDETKVVLELLVALLESLIAQAEACLHVVMPGYTHLQRAQPVLFSHHLMAYFEMFRRDHRRISHCLTALNESPLGAGALAGVDFPVDRGLVAQELGFASICRNSIDAVSDRDYLLEFLFAASVIGVHLSRFCEELVLWSSQEFGFIELDDLFCTGSSIMPQKRNPDFAELIRAKTGGLVGHLISMLVTLKGLPLAYNKDLQEDKRPMFEAMDTVQACLRVFAEMVGTMRVLPERMGAATEEGYLTATDLADYLVERGRSFRTAHGVAAAIVRTCLEQGVPLSKLELAELRRFDPVFDQDVYQVLDPRRSVERRASVGGTATAQVKRAIQTARRELDALQRA
jgi:argininosuccinate lyase